MTHSAASASKNPTNCVGAGQPLGQQADHQGNAAGSDGRQWRGQPHLAPRHTHKEQQYAQPTAQATNQPVEQGRRRWNRFAHDQAQRHQGGCADQLRGQHDTRRGRPPAGQPARKIAAAPGQRGREAGQNDDRIHEP